MVAWYAGEPTRRRSTAPLSVHNLSPTARRRFTRLSIVMPYEAFVPDDCDYVEIKWYGDATGAEMRQSGVDALKLAATQNVSKILIDVSQVRNRLSTIDLFMETVRHSRLGPPRPRAALVGKADQAQDLKFIETVGANRGMPIRAFTSTQDAVDWLTA